MARRRRSRACSARGSTRSCPRIWIDGPTARVESERSEEHTSELQSQSNLVCRLLLEKKKKKQSIAFTCLHLRHDDKQQHLHVSYISAECAHFLVSLCGLVSSHVKFTAASRDSITNS